MKKGIFLKIFVAITYLGMIVVNALSNILPINGNNTGQVSNAYPNLFAPAALTFSIWGVIYFLLAAYTLYQFGLFKKMVARKTLLCLPKLALILPPPPWPTFYGFFPGTTTSSLFLLSLCS